MGITLALFCAAIVGVSLLGGLLPLATVLTHTRLQIYLSFSAGAMLGAAFFHMLPEAVRLGSAGTLRWSALGLLALFFLERFFAFHHHEAPADPAEPCPTHPHEHTQGHGHSAGLVVDGGPAGPGRGQGDVAALGGRRVRPGRALTGRRRGAGQRRGGRRNAAAVALASGRCRGLGGVPGHPGPQAGRRPDDRQPDAPRRGPAAPRPPGQPGFRRDDPAGRGPVLHRDRPAGARGRPAWTAAALAFSAGTFLCIALSDLLPELQFHAHDRTKLSLALLAGFALMGITALAEPEESVVPDQVPPPTVLVEVRRGTHFTPQNGPRIV